MHVSLWSTLLPGRDFCGSTSSCHHRHLGTNKLSKFKIIAKIFRFGIHILGFAKTWIELENFLVCSFWWQKSETNIYFRPDWIGQSSEVFEALHTIINQLCVGQFPMYGWKSSFSVCRGGQPHCPVRLSRSLSTKRCKLCMLLGMQPDKWLSR